MRPIDADALIRRAVERYKEMMGTDIGHGMGIIASMITDSPVLTLDDLRPKGRWENPHKPRCSNCKKPARRDSSGGLLPVCLYCLADMRGGGEDG